MHYERAKRNSGDPGPPEQLQLHRAAEGHRFLTNGYVSIKCTSHPLANPSGYVPEHRMMAWDVGLLSDPAMDVHHINGIKTDNRLENLEVLSKADHASRHSSGERNGMARLSTEAVVSIRALAAAGGVTQVSLASQFGISDGQVSKIVSGTSWAHIALGTEG
jgi:hypothetical protein